MSSQYSVQELFEALQRIEATTERDVTANAVMRDSEAPTINVYYKRFGNSWPVVMEYYTEWKRTGELPELDERDWKKFVRSMRSDY